MKTLTNLLIIIAVIVITQLMGCKKDEPVKPVKPVDKTMVRPNDKPTVYNR